MLVLAAALFTLAPSALLSCPPETLAEKLVVAGQKRGWSKVSSHASGKRYLVDLELQATGRKVDITVGEKKAAPALAKELKQMRKAQAKMTEIEELQLTGTGLTVEVPDFSTMRISNMKEYAGNQMRISGIVNGRVVFIYLNPRKDETAKTGEETYEDVVSFGKLVFSDLKK